MVGQRPGKCNSISWMTLKGELKGNLWTSLVAQWLRIHLSMQGSQVQSQVQEDPICRRATKPVCHNYWACTLEPKSHNNWAHAPKLLKPVNQSPCSAIREATTMRSPCTTTNSGPCSPQLEKALMQRRKPNAAKNK